MADADIIARLRLNAKDFSTEFASAMDITEAKAKSAGLTISNSFGKTAGEGIRNLSAQVPVLGSALTGLSGSALIAGAGIGALAAGLLAAVKVTEEYQQQARQLDAVLKATGNATGYTSDQLKQYAEDLETALAIPAEQLLKAETALSSFDGVAGTTFKRAIKDAADLAAVYGGDVASNAEKLGVVLQNLAEGHVEGLAKGFKFLGTQTIQAITHLSELGDAAGAQAALLDALEKKVGGAGGAASQGISGAFFRMSDAIEDASRAFATQSGLYDATVGGLNAVAGAVEKTATAFTNMTTAQTIYEAWKKSLYLIPGIGAAANIVLPSFGAPKTFNVTADATAAAAKYAEDASAKAAVDKANAAAKAAAAADAAAAAQKTAADEAKRQADEAERAAKALAERRKALDGELVAMENEAQAASLTAEDRAFEAKLFPLLAKYSGILTANDRLRAVSAAAMRVDVAATVASLGGSVDALNADADASIKKTTAAVTASMEAGQKAAQKGQEDLAKSAQLKFEYLSNAFYDVFSGRSGDIWGKFKEMGARTLAELAAQFVLTGSINVGSTAIGGLLGAATGSGGLLGTASSIGGLAGLGGLIGSAGGSLAIGGAGVGTLTTAAGLTVGGTSGLVGTAGAGILGSLGGAGAALAAAAPYLALAAGAAVLISQLAKKDPYSDAGISTSASGIASGRTASRGTNTAATLVGDVSDQLAAIAKQLGGTVTSGVDLGSIGTNNKNYYYNPSGYGYKAAGTQVYGSAADAEAAAVEAALAKGAIGGVSATVKNILSGSGDIASRINKAAALQSSLAAIDQQLDPTGTAIKALNDQFATLRDTMVAAGASSEEMAKASAAYDQQLAALQKSTSGGTSALSDFLQSLKVGSGSPLSLRDQEAAARAAYAAASASIGTSGFDASSFTSAGRQLIDISRAINGSTDFGVFNQVTSDTQRALAAGTGAGGDNPFLKKTADATAATADNTSLTVEALANLPAQIAAALAAAGVSVGGSNRGFVPNVAAA